MRFFPKNKFFFRNLRKISRKDENYCDWILFLFIFRILAKFRTPKKRCPAFLNHLPVSKAVIKTGHLITNGSYFTDMMQVLSFLVPRGSHSSRTGSNNRWPALFVGMERLLETALDNRQFPLHLGDTPLILQPSFLIIRRFSSDWVWSLLNRCFW